MKNLKKQLFIAVALLALVMSQNFAVNAQNNITLRQYKPGQQIAQLSISFIDANAPASIIIKDERGVVLFQDKTKGELNYGKLIDFKRIRSGKYIVDVMQADKLVRKVLVKDNNNIVIEDGSYSLTSNIKKLDTDTKKLLVKINNDIKEKVNITITDKEGHVIHEIANIDKIDYAAVFNLSKLNSGVYNMNFISSNFSNSKSFVVE